MNYWLVKSEPSVWSWDQQVAKGAKGEAWTGVRNFTARQNLVAMKKGDKAFFYHSNEGKEIVGIALGRGEPPPEDKLAEGAFTAPVLVELAASQNVDMPVSNAVAAILAGKVTIDAAIEGLLTRPFKAEE